MAKRYGKDTAGTKQTPRRGGKGFRHAAETARKAAERIAGTQGFAEADVLLRWPEIAGEAVARICRPVRVRYGSNRSLGAVLIVEAEGGRAPEIAHQGPRIVERVNQFYGYRAINRIKIEHAAMRAKGFAEPAAAFQGPEPEPTRGDRRKATEMVDGVENSDLRDALAQMGAYVLAQDRKGPDRKV